MNGKRNEEERELQKSGLGFWSIRSSELYVRSNEPLSGWTEWSSEAFAQVNFVFARSDHSLDQGALADKGLLEQPLSVWVSSSELWVRSSDHFSVWVCSSELESTRANLILDRVLIEAENLANRSDLMVWSIGGLRLSPVGFGFRRKHGCFLDTYMSSKLALWLINANRGWWGLWTIK